MAPWVSLALLLSSLVGFSLGLLGGGGSILAVPVLVFVAGIVPKEAIPMSLAIVGGTSVVGSAMHRSRRSVDSKAALLFGLSSIAGAVIGARAGLNVSGEVLLLAFGILMVAVAMWMYGDGAQRIAGGLAYRHRTRKLLTAGAVVGVLTGLLGVGGGFLIVPALVLFAGLPMPTAIGTSLVVIALNSGVAAAVHLQALDVDYPLTLAFTAFSVAGAWAGFRVSREISPQRLRRAFAVLVFTVGVLVTARAGWDALALH